MAHSLVIAAPETSEKAAPSRFVFWFKGLPNFLATAAAVRRQRRELAGLDEHMLRDIGMTKFDVQRETSRNFWDIA